MLLNMQIDSNAPAMIALPISVAACPTQGPVSFWLIFHFINILVCNLVHVSVCVTSWRVQFGFIYSTD